MTTEFRYCEVRREGRVLSGAGIVYGDVARIGSRAERFLPGALGADVGALDVILNTAHDRGRPLARTGGGGLTLTDTAESLTLRAELPETREATDTLALVEAGVLRGISLEFQAISERMEGPTRVLVRAKLLGLAIVDRPAYPASTVEARAQAEAERVRDRHTREFLL